MGFQHIYVCESLCQEIDEDLSTAELTYPILTGQCGASWETHGGCIGAKSFKHIVGCIGSNATSVMNGIKWAMEGAGNIVLWFLLNYHTIPVYAVEREVHRMEYLESQVEKYSNRIAASRCMKYLYDFTDDEVFNNESLWSHMRNGRGFIWFNNFNLDRGVVNLRFEEIVGKYVCVGTVILTTAPLFCGREWCGVVKQMHGNSRRESGVTVNLPGGCFSWMGEVSYDLNVYCYEVVNDN